MERTIQVTGRGTVRRAPDRVRLTLAVSAKDADYARATERAEADAEKVLAALSPLTQNVKALSLRVEPVFETVEQGGTSVRRQAGFEATRRLRAEFSAEPVLLAKIVKAVSACGASPTLSAEYLLSDESGARREAAALAVQDARARAEAIAGAAGVTLGAVRGVESGARGGFPAVRAMAMKACDLSDLAPEEIALDEDVTMLFDIG